MKWQWKRLRFRAERHLKAQKRVSYLHRTATTRYRCFDQDLAEFSGSWSCRTYPLQSYNFFLSLQNEPVKIEIALKKNHDICRAFFVRLIKSIIVSSERMEAEWQFSQRMIITYQAYWRGMAYVAHNLDTVSGVAYTETFAC